MTGLYELQKVIEGQYKYWQQDKQYAEEHFSVSFNKQNENHYFRSEVTMRISNGDLLKTLVTCQLNRQYQLVAAQIHSQKGQEKSDQIFLVDEHQGILNYKFKHVDRIERQERPWGHKHHLSLPVTCLSTSYLLLKKFEVTKASPIILITAENNLNFKETLQEKIIWGMWRDLEQKELIINQNKLQASEFHLFEKEPDTAMNEEPIKVRPSKHLYIPYLIMGHQGLKIEIEFLKKFELSLI